ncbi:MAG: hypothetical protein KKB34_08640 [Bacteroidetes bacterium]|nr:hypothetical protein [Bacteroidota bacterium]
MNRFVALYLVVLLPIIIACGSTNNENDTDKLLKDNISLNSAEISPQSNSASIVKKYPFKSGIISFQRGGVIGNAEIIVYFDDYGTKERNEVYGEDGILSEITMSDGVNMYKIRKREGDEKIAYLMGSGLHGTEMKFVVDPFNNNEKRKTKYEYQKLNNMNVIKKVCEAYRIKSSGGKTTFAGWNGLLLYTKVEMSMGTMETIAVDFKENADVDPGLFKIPGDFKIEKM